MAVTGWKSAGTAANIATAGTAWADPGNIISSDNVYATTAAIATNAASTQTLRAYNFGFTTSDIPAGSRIDGIEVTIERKANNASRIADGVVSLIINSAGTAADRVGDNYAKAGTWTTSDVVQSYGGAADYWSALVFENDVRGSNFGVDFIATTTSKSTVTPSVDAILMRVHYTAGATDTKNVVQVITTTGSGTWTAPANCTSLALVEGWGAGGDGTASNSGGGGAWAAIDDVPVGAGTFDYLIAASAGGDTWFGSPTTLLAKGGGDGVGGQASACIGDFVQSGGDAGTNNPGQDSGNTYFGGGGGAATKNSAGGAGLAGTAGSTNARGGHAGTGGAVATTATTGISHVEGGSGGAGGAGLAGANYRFAGSGGAPGGGGGSNSRTTGSANGQGIGGRGQIRITYSVTGSGDAPVEIATGVLATSTKTPIANLSGTVAKSASLNGVTKRPVASLSGTVSAPTTGTFGTTTSNSTGWGLAVAGMALTRFTVPEAALITKVTANLPTSVAATLARAVIYADNSGSPGARIGFSDNVSVATGLLDFPFTTQPTLSPGYVWIGVQANGEFLLARNTANMGIRFRAETWNVSAPPATWSGTSYESDAGLALLTTYTAVVVPTPDITATLNGVTKKPVASLSGSVSKTATLNTTTKRPVAALTGTVAKTASLNTSTKPPVAAFMGTVAKSAVLDTVTKKPVGGLFGTVAKSASLQASTKRPTASFSGVVAKSAVLNTTTKKATGGLAGTVSKTALLSTVTKKPTGGLNGIVAKQGVLNTTTKRPVAALVGSVSKVAILSTITRKPQASFGGTVAKSATLNAVTKKATAQFSGTVSAPLAINTTPPIIAGSPQLGQILTMAPGVWDIGSATLISTAHEWYVGEIATGRTGPTFAISSPEMMSEEVTVRETITTTAGTSVAVSAPITVEPAVHHIFRGSITGVPASASGWTNSDRIITADGLSASFVNASGAGVSSPVLSATFDFTAFDLPHGSSIDGVELRIMRSGSAAGLIADEALTLTVNGSTSSELASAASWPTILGEAVYGGSTNLLGLSPVALVPSDGLEIALDLQTTNGASSTANIDSVSIKIFYSVPVLNGVGWPVNVVPPVIAGVATPGSTVTVTSLGVWEPEPIPVWYYKFLFLDGPDPETATIIGYDYSDDPTYQVPAMALRYPDGGGAVSTVGRYLVAAVINDEAPEDQAGYSNALMVEATNAATLNAVTKKAIGGLTGTVAKQATLNAVTKKPIGGLSARTVARATLNTITKKPVGGLVGTVAVQASLNTVTKKPTGGLSGLLIGHVATLNAVTKKPIGGLSGFIVPSDIRGSLNTTTKRPTASLTGAVMASDCPTDRVVVFEREVRTGRFKAEHRTVVFDPETRTVRFPK